MRNENNLDTDELIKFIEKNPQLTMRQISDITGVKRSTVNNTVLYRGLVVKRARTDTETIQKRLDYIKENLHLSRAQIASDLNVSKQCIVAFCRFHKISLFRENIFSEKDIASISLCIKENPQLDRQQLSAILGVSVTTISRTADKFNLPFSGRRAEGRRKVFYNATSGLMKYKSLPVVKPKGDFNALLMKRFS